MIRYPYRKHNKKSGADKNNGTPLHSLKIEANVEANLQQIRELTSGSRTSRALSLYSAQYLENVCLFLTVK